MQDITLQLFAQRLKNLRESRNLSTRILAETIGVSNATISRYETGKRDPDLLTAHKIAQYFGVTVEYLCGDNLDTRVDSMVDMYTKLSEESKQDAIKYITYLYEKGK